MNLLTVPASSSVKASLCSNLLNGNLTYGIEAAERGVQGSIGAFDADDCSLGVRGVVTGQGLMVGMGGLSVRVALRRRIGASVAGD